MEFVSIGPYCMTADILKQYKLRLNSYPFDYIFSSLEVVKHAINDKFNIFLEKSYYSEGTNDHSMRHTFYCKMLDTEVLHKQHTVNGGFSNDYNVSTGNFFNHHNLLNDDETYEKFKRRCDRFLKLISEKKTICVYYNCHTTDFDELKDFAASFSDNENMFIVGMYFNENGKSIVHESPNCKIYQNYDLWYIFDEIKSKFNT